MPQVRARSLGANLGIIDGRGLRDGSTPNSLTSMISKSQEETEVSWRLEEWALEAEMGRLSLANGLRSLCAAKAAAWPDIHLRETGSSPVHEA